METAEHKPKPIRQVRALSAKSAHKSPCAGLLEREDLSRLALTLVDELGPEVLSAGLARAAVESAAWCYSFRQLQDLLSCGESWLYQMKDAGYLKTRLIGRKRRVLHEDLVTFLRDERWRE